jgi:hypothetical protein
VDVSSSISGGGLFGRAPVIGIVVNPGAHSGMLKVKKTYEGKSRGSESRFELALLDPPLPPGVLYAFFAGDDEGNCLGLDEPAEVQ